MARVSDTSLNLILFVGSPRLFGNSFGNNKLAIPFSFHSLIDVGFTLGQFNFSFIKSTCSCSLFQLATKVSYGSSNVFTLLKLISGPIRRLSTFGIMASSSIVFKSVGIPFKGNVSIKFLDHLIPFYKIYYFCKENVTQFLFALYKR